MNLIMLCILLSGSVFGSIVLKKRFEEIIPLTLMSIMLILFFFGLVGFLYAGVLVVLCIVIFLYVFSIWGIIRQRKHKKNFRELFSPGFFVFVVLFLLLCHFNEGKLANLWDEFSHWMDAVKAMSYIDDFVTNPKAHSQFASYPPAMACVQYFFQKIFFIVSGDDVFNEWRMYLVYQIFSFAMLFPFLNNWKKNKLFENAALVLILILLPSFFFNEFFITIYIDPFVGLIAGCAFAYILFHEEKSCTYYAYIILACMTLVLSKDVGLYFAVFVSIAYAIDILAEKRIGTFLHNKEFKKSILSIMMSMPPLAGTIIIKFLWNHELKESGAAVAFGGKIDIIGYTSMFFRHDDKTYRQIVVDNYKDAFYNHSISLGQLNMTISYFGLFIVFAVLMYILYRIAAQKNAKWIRKSTKPLILIVLLQLVLYIYCLGATYVSNFSEYEATSLASYNRYINMSYLSVFIVLVIGAMYTAKESHSGGLFTLIALVVMLVICPIGGISDFINQDSIRQSAQNRASYYKLQKLIEKYCDGNDKIYFISEGSQGYEYWVTRFNARPNEFSENFTWSLGEPQYEGDIWTTDMSVEDWKKILHEEGYTHIAIYKVNEYFRKTYSLVFAEPDNICSNSLYEINNSTGLYELCQ